MAFYLWNQDYIVTSLGGLLWSPKGTPPMSIESWTSLFITLILLWSLIQSVSFPQPVAPTEDCAYLILGNMSSPGTGLGTWTSEWTSNLHIKFKVKKITFFVSSQLNNPLILHLQSTVVHQRISVYVFLEPNLKTTWNEKKGWNLSLNEQIGLQESNWPSHSHISNKGQIWAFSL